MNKNVLNDLDVIQSEYPKINFEVVDDLLFNKHKYYTDIIDIRTLLDTLNDYAETIGNKKIKIFANDIVSVSKKQYRDMKQDCDSLYFFLRGFILDGLEYSNKRTPEGYHLCKWIDPNFFPYKKTMILSDSLQYDCCGYGANIFSVFFRNSKQSIFTHSEVSMCIIEFIDSLYKNKEENEDEFENIKKTITENVMREIQNQLNEIESINEDLQNAQNTVKTLLKKKNEAEVKLKQLSENKQKKITSFLSIITNGTKIKGIESVSFSDDCQYIKIKTGPIYVNSMGYTFYMGKYMATVNIKNTSVTFTNLEPEHRRQSYWSKNDMHPHVSNTGNPCLGNIAESIMIAIKNVDIKSICIIILSYLSSVNPADAAGKYLTNWDIVDENGKIIDFPEELKSCNSCGARVTELTKSDFNICFECGHNHCNQHCKEYDVRHNKELSKKHLCVGCVPKYTTCSTCGCYTKASYVCCVCGTVHCEECVVSTHFGDKPAYACTSCYNEIKENKSDTFALVSCSQCGTETILDKEYVENIINYTCEECKSNQCVFCKKPTGKRHILTEFGEKLCIECWKATDRCDACQTLQLKDNLIYNDINNTKKCKDGCHNHQDCTPEDDTTNYEDDALPFN